MDVVDRKLGVIIFELRYRLIPRRTSAFSVFEHDLRKVIMQKSIVGMVLYAL